jgi:hypothetical protein
MKDRRLTRKLISGTAILLCGLIFENVGLAGQRVPSHSDLARVIVRVSGVRHAPPPELHRADVLVYQSGKRRPVVSWTPLVRSAGKLDFAILMDDSLTPTVGLQFHDIRSFVRSLPAGTRVALAYAKYGSADFAAKFTSNREAVLQSLRLPIGPAGLGSSIYMALDSLIRKWPHDGAAREVLVISSGIDLFRGIDESEPTEANLDLMRAIGTAQRHGVTVHTLYAESAGFEGRNYFLINNGQGSLSRLAFQTGGASFQQGLQSPISFAPYLDDLSRILGEQFLLTFRLQPAQRSGFEPLRVTTEVPGANLAAPDRVFVPAMR